MQVHELIGEVGCESDNYLGPARVVSPGSDAVLVEMGGLHRSAMPAVPGYQPRAGDQVLVIGQRDKNLYVIGVLNTRGRGLRFAVEQGDVEFVAARGKMRFVAEGGVEMISAMPIQIRSRMGVVLSVLSRAGKLVPRLAVGREKTEISNTEILTEADRVSQHSKTSRLETERLEVESHTTDANAETVRLGIGTLHSRIRNVYARVEALWQLAAGRTRMVVKGTSHHKAQRLYSKAEKDVKVKADQIYLG